ncbi:putative late blight resistance protein homolog R1B-14 [Solanum verrucosum]|uniref:putative late blight resistance protein homolog R1B-14 n=1 Tax=Solanum verrucosum TaxID=315347 RepID=UPI0020D1425C|nr:putative late blight resistance protein homolog R1B-14 [Solanum verrucosum]
MMFRHTLECRNQLGNIPFPNNQYLIVLDDVWDTAVVDFVKKAFPNNESQPRGDRIMLTTRQRRVAEAVSAHPHNLEKLSKGDSFKLLEQRVFGKTRECPIKLRGYGNEIVDKCCGVPLAIVVIAGALRGCLGESDWKLVKDNVGKHLLNKDDNKSCLKFVETSYNHLPQQRKAAFLYFGVFPQGFDILARKLILLWVAEGLIKSGLQGSKIEEVAETYLSDFAGRNLVMVMQKRSNGQIKTCRLHDMLHEFCIIEAERISLFQQLECLTVLKLKENAFIGKNWKPKKGCFSNLQVLWIDWAQNWET